MKSEMVKDDAWIPTVCQMCLSYCGIKAHRVNGVVVELVGNPDCPRSKGRICAKGLASIMTLYNPHRLTTPLKRTNPEKGIGVDPKWVEITWKEALGTIVEKLKKLRKEDPRKLAIITFDLDYMEHWQGVFGHAFGTALRWSGGASYFCGPSLHQFAYLLQGAFEAYGDIDNCNYMMVWGCQFGFGASTASTLDTGRMADARIRGMKVVVIDPVLSTAAAKADEWIPLRPGTDGALALGMLNVLLNELGVYDVEFLKKYTNAPYLIGLEGHYFRDKIASKPLVWDVVDGKAKTYNDPDIKDLALEGSYEIDGTTVKPAFQLLKEHVRKYTPEEVAEITTVSAETIRRIAREFGDAARIGSKIVIEGKELPYRPASITLLKGTNAQKHGFQTNFAIELLNIIVGNIDMPGGKVGIESVLLPNNIINRSWAPTEDSDGMLVSSDAPYGTVPPPAYPARKVKRPERADLYELFPVAGHSAPISQVVMLDPERFKISNTPEVLLHCRSNYLMSTQNPEQVAEVLKKFSFIFSFASEINETVEFADIVLPDTHYLERFDGFLNGVGWADGVGRTDWAFLLRQPVVAPPPGVRNWLEVLFEIADRVGFLRDIYHMLNLGLKLKEPDKFELNKKYSLEEAIDICARSWFGPEHGLDWLKKRGLVRMPKKVEEAYPRVFIKPRIPMYMEHLVKAGEDIKKVTDEMGIPWDTSDYQPLPDWKPRPDYEEESPEYDLYAANYKVPFQTFTITANNPWINEISEHHPTAYYIRINSQTAKNKGIKDNELIWVQGVTGERVKGRARLTEGIHPEVVGIAGTFGHWAKGLPIAKGKGVHFNTLLPIQLERIDMISGSVDASIKVKISKASEVPE